MSRTPPRGRETFFRAQTRRALVPAAPPREPDALAALERLVERAILTREQADAAARHLAPERGRALREPTEAA